MTKKTQLAEIHGLSLYTIASQKTEPKNKTIIKIKKTTKKNANIPKSAARPIRHHKQNLKGKKKLFEVKNRRKSMKKNANLANLARPANKTQQCWAFSMSN